MANLQWPSIVQTSSTASFPQPHTETFHLAARNTQKTKPGFTWEYCRVLMWYWWKAPPWRVIDFLSYLWRIWECLVFCSESRWNRFLLGLLQRSEICALLLSAAGMHPRGGDVSESFQCLWKLYEVIKQCCKLQRAVRLCPNSKVCEERAWLFNALIPLMNDSKPFLPGAVLHLGLKGKYLRVWTLKDAADCR